MASIQPSSAISAEGNAVSRGPPRRQRGRKPPHRLGARGGDGDRDLGGLVLGGVEPMGVGARAFEQPVARAQRALERGHPRGMGGIDREHQAIEEAPPLRGGTGEQSVHGRDQPDHPQMVGEGRGRTGRLAVDPVLAKRRGLRAAGRLDAGAERGEAERAVDLGRHRPGARRLR